MNNLNFLNILESVICSRKIRSDCDTYTSRLFSGGRKVISNKVLEEASELVESVKDDSDVGRGNSVREAADLLFHTMVLLRWRGIDLQEVINELERRAK